jgi:dCTP deaminase
MWSAMSASFRRIPLRSPVPLSTSEYRGNVLTICLGKSTYARCGIIVNVTPLEPEWEGHVTLEFSNTTTLPAKIYANEGVAQMLFFESDEVCEVSYKDRGGKYQGQRGVTLPKA